MITLCPNLISFCSTNETIFLASTSSLVGAVGAHGNGLKEEVEARKIVSLVEQKLKKLGHKVVICSCDKEKDGNKHLHRIVSVANAHKDADLFVSVHMNAFAKESANGVETFSYSKSGKGHDYATKVQNELVKLGYTNRGKKEAGFYVLRHTAAPAILVECGFITSKKDVSIHNPVKISDAIVLAITGQMVKVEEPTKEVLYRVVAGTYSDRKNAEAMVTQLSVKGVKSFITIIEK